ncbi:hypothetical protein [Dokdonella sp.]|uniref:hypothetical protein n=1 Tax=Dokdonella sp. TaxID=2291710 RepID=UPI001B210503|nr:hypothetical protein [Dokdonella sp.]MBO9661557.1 sel1 repeat family protein [Dokdonella sp.]
MNAVSRSVLLAIAFTVVGAHASPDGMRSDDPKIVNSDAFIRAHPDLRFRRSGMEAYERKRFKEAFGYFQDAAHYADKTSQAMVAEMLWNGVGVAQDRSLAYAWMDMAAERNYPSLIVLRERYWSQLDATEQARAVEAGKPVFAKYADDVAKPRLERELQRERYKATGSRLGRVGTLSLPSQTHVSKQQPQVDGGKATDAMGTFSNFVDGSKYYAAEYWNPKEYWRWQDAQWQRLGDGSVIVGAPQGVGKWN